MDLNFSFGKNFFLFFEKFIEKLIEKATPTLASNYP
jgi:hypothetical protein